MTALTITGNLAYDPELKFTPSGKAVASFTVISSKSTKNLAGEWENSEVTPWNIKCWNKTAENVADSLRKGMSVVVVGTASWVSWEDKATGEKKGKLEVTAWNVGVDLKRHNAIVGQVERVGAGEKVKNDPWEITTDDAPPF